MRTFASSGTRPTKNSLSFTRRRASTQCRTDFRGSRHLDDDSVRVCRNETPDGGMASTPGCFGLAGCAWMPPFGLVVIVSRFCFDFHDCHVAAIAVCQDPPMRLLGLEVHRPGLPAPYGELRRLFDLVRVDHVIDVGANHGQYATALRNLGFAGPIDCVEPQPACAAELRRRGDVNVHEVALSTEPGRSTLHVYRDDSLSSLHQLNDLGRSLWDDSAVSDEVDQVEIGVITLDALLSRISLGERIWLKLDTQGHDLRVLDGLGGDYLPRIVGAQSEVAFTKLYDDAPHAWTSLEGFAKRGFTLADLTPITRVDDGVIAEADCFFIRALS